MRVFWSLMLVLFVASMGVFVRPTTPDRAPTRGEQARAAEDDSEPRLPPQAEADLRLWLDETRAELLQNVEAAGSVEAEDAGHEPAADPTPEPATDQQSDAAIPVEAPAADVQFSEAPDPFAAAAEAYLRSRGEGAAEPMPVPAEQPAAVQPAAVEPVEDAPAESERASAAPAPAAGEAFEVLPDGSLRIGETVVTGDGSAARPYLIDWPLLTGVARVYKPEKGMKDLPAWLSLLEGRRVRLTGHVVLPLVATSTDEVLLTMNPWDGCCVGVPPTPYDAMEVTMSEPLTMQGASMYGSVEGTLRTDPYIAGGWLLGLYLLDDARVVK